MPRRSRICLVVRLIMPWRLPRWTYTTLPVPVSLKRFFAPDLVFNLGIWLSSRLDAFLTFGGAKSPVRASEKTATAALTAGRFSRGGVIRERRRPRKGGAWDLRGVAAAPLMGPRRRRKQELARGDGDRKHSRRRRAQAGVGRPHMQKILLAGLGMDGSTRGPCELIRSGPSDCPIRWRPRASAQGGARPLRLPH